MIPVSLLLQSVHLISLKVFSFDRQTIHRGVSDTVMTLEPPSGDPECKTTATTSISVIHFTFHINGIHYFVCAREDIGREERNWHVSTARSQYVSVCE